jgi:hypothetical protein
MDRSRVPVFGDGGGRGGARLTIADVGEELGCHVVGVVMQLVCLNMHQKQEVDRR